MPVFFPGSNQGKCVINMADGDWIYTRSGQGPAMVSPSGLCYKVLHYGHQAKAMTLDMLTRNLHICLTMWSFANGGNLILLMMRDAALAMGVVNCPLLLLFASVSLCSLLYCTLYLGLINDYNGHPIMAPLIHKDHRLTPDPTSCNVHWFLSHALCTLSPSAASPPWECLLWHLNPIFSHHSKPTLL